MARVTLGNIITYGHLMADVPEPSTSRSGAFASEDEIAKKANDGLSELHDILMNKYEDWLTTKGTINLYQGNETTILPSDFYKLKKLFLLDGNQRVSPDPFELDDLEGTTTTETSTHPDYKIMGNRIYWRNLPSANQQSEIWYIRQFKPLVNRDDEIAPELPAGWDTYPIAYVAKYLLGKAERDPSIAILEMRTVKDRIESAATNRDASRPRTSKDVSGRFERKRRYPDPRA